MSLLFEVILPVFMVIGCGYVCRWRGIFSDETIDGIMQFAQGFAVPMLLFSAVSRLNLSNDFDIRLWIAFYTGAAVAFLLAAGFSRFRLKRSGPDSVVIGFAAWFSNSLLLGIAITQRAFGEAALAGNFAIIAIHSPLLYMVGITTMEIVQARGSGAGPLQLIMRSLKGVVRTPLVIGVIAGLAINLATGAGLVVPEPVWAAVDMIARAGLPAALFGLGGVLYRYRPEGDLGAIAVVVAASLVVHPAIGYGVGRLLDINEAGLRSIVMTAAMAPGINAYLFANIYGHAKRVAASAVLIGTVVSIFSIWIWLQILI